ncbi:nucleotidyltransferase family protein [Sphingomonas bacterium]|uniref:nucleotidyltransferase family protein n=1 Tax=Sphingomonas bacterium TaxID=1895847 RepID=UPI0015774C94|nr:NTP transferase domain-containing protein [Sphingomonas bacterium]
MRVSLLLAGGEGRRFGRQDKLLATIGGAPVLLHALRAARLAGRRTLLVLPPGFAPRRAVIARARWPGLTVLVARDARRGIGASLARGIAALRPIDREVAIFLADMPFARAPLRWAIGADRDAVRPVYRGRPGHPVLVRAAILRGLAIAPDAGLAALLDRRRAAGIAGSPGHALDIDTPRALRRLRHRIATRAGAFHLGNKERRCSKLPHNGSRPPRR